MNSPDIIKDASDALQQISDGGIIVMQGWYDKNIHDRHVTLRLQFFSESAQSREMRKRTHRKMRNREQRPTQW